MAIFELDGEAPDITLQQPAMAKPIASAKTCSTCSAVMTPPLRITPFDPSHGATPRATTSLIKG